MKMKLRQQRRSTCIRLAALFAFAAVLFASHDFALAGLSSLGTTSPLGAAWDGRQGGLAEPSANSLVLSADETVASNEDSAARAVEVPEPGVPSLLIGLGVVGLLLAASHRMRAIPGSPHAFDDWDMEPTGEPRRKSP